MIIPPAPSRYLDQSGPGGVFHGLQPVSSETVEEIANEHRNISTSYLAFIAQIGTGYCRAGNFVLPVPIEELVGHQSYKLYRSRSYLSLFPKRRPKAFPLGALWVADSGASWKYCFGPELGEAIYTFDLADGTLDQTHASFESLLDEWLPASSDGEQPTF